MNKEDLLSLLRDWGVLQEGHFLLTSGRHSPTFLLFARAFEYPERGARLAEAFSELVTDLKADTICGPAMGGVLLGYEVARRLRLRCIYTEKDGEQMALRRGFSVHPGERVLVVEDAVTTGGSVRKSIAAIRRADADVVGVLAIADRSGGRVRFDVPFRWLIRLDVPSFDAADCPDCQAGRGLTRPKA